MSFKNQTNNDETPKKDRFNFSKDNNESGNGKIHNESISSKNEHFPRSMNDGPIHNTKNFKSSTKEKDGNNNMKVNNNDNSSNNKRDDRIPSFADFLMFQMMNGQTKQDDTDGFKEVCPSPKDSEKCHKCPFNPNKNSSNLSPVHTNDFEEFLHSLVSSVGLDIADIIFGNGTNDDSEPENDVPETEIDNEELKDIIKMQQIQIRLILTKLDVIMKHTEPVELETGELIEMEGLNFSYDEIQYVIKRQMKKLRRIIDERDEVVNQKLDMIIHMMEKMSSSIDENMGQCKCDPKKSEKK